MANIAPVTSHLSSPDGLPDNFSDTPESWSRALVESEAVLKQTRLLSVRAERDMLEERLAQYPCAWITNFRKSGECPCGKPAARFARYFLCRQHYRLTLGRIEKNTLNADTYANHPISGSEWPNAELEEDGEESEEEGDDEGAEESEEEGDDEGAEESEEEGDDEGADEVGEEVAEVDEESEEEGDEEGDEEGADEVGEEATEVDEESEEEGDDEGADEVGEEATEVDEESEEEGDDEGADEVGEEVAEVGEEADEVAEVGEEVAEVDEEAAEVGEEAAEVDEGADEVGEEVAEVGEEADEVAEVGEEVAEVDEEAAEVGEEAAEVGEEADEVAEVGEEVAEVDEEAAEVGEEVAEADEEVAEVDEEAAEVGEEVAEVDEEEYEDSKKEGGNESKAGEGEEEDGEPYSVGEFEFDGYEPYRPAIPRGTGGPGNGPPKPAKHTMPRPRGKELQDQRLYRKREFLTRMGQRRSVSSDDSEFEPYAGDEFEKARDDHMENDRMTKALGVAIAGEINECVDRFMTADSREEAAYYRGLQSGRETGFWGEKAHDSYLVLRKATANGTYVYSPDHPKCLARMSARQDFKRRFRLRDGGGHRPARFKAGVPLYTRDTDKYGTGPSIEEFVPEEYLRFANEEGEINAQHIGYLILGDTLENPTISMKEYHDRRQTMRVQIINETRARRMQALEDEFMNGGKSKAKSGGKKSRAKSGGKKSRAKSGGQVSGGQVSGGQVSGGQASAEKKAEVVTSSRDPVGFPSGLEEVLEWVKHEALDIVNANGMKPADGFDAEFEKAAAHVWMEDTTVRQRRDHLEKSVKCLADPETIQRVLGILDEIGAVVGGVEVCE